MVGQRQTATSWFLYQSGNSEYSWLRILIDVQVLRDELNMPDSKNRYSEAANWLIRIENALLLDLERARFKRWLNTSEWNRQAFDRVSVVWHGAPISTEIGEKKADDYATQFTWRYTDAWRDAVLPLLLTNNHLEGAGAFGSSAGGIQSSNGPTSLSHWAAAPPILL